MEGKEEGEKRKGLTLYPIQSDRTVVKYLMNLCWKESECMFVFIKHLFSSDV